MSKRKEYKKFENKNFNIEDPKKKTIGIIGSSGSKTAKKIIKQLNRLRGKLKYLREGTQLQNTSSNKESKDLSIYFHLADYNANEIAVILSTFSELYASIGGDKLVIKNMFVLNSINHPKTVEV